MTLPPLALNAWEAYREGWRRYTDFRGRSSFSDYLRFFALNLAVGLLLRALEALFGNGFFSLMGLLYGLAALLPGLAITVRLFRFLIGRESAQ